MRANVRPGVRPNMKLTAGKGHAIPWEEGGSRFRHFSPDQVLDRVWRRPLPKGRAKEEKTEGGGQEQSPRSPRYRNTETRH